MPDPQDACPAIDLITAPMSAQAALRAFLIAGVNLHEALARGLRADAPTPLIAAQLGAVAQILNDFAKPHGDAACAARLADVVAAGGRLRGVMSADGRPVAAAARGVPLGEQGA